MTGKPARLVSHFVVVFLGLSVALSARAEGWPVPRGASHEPAPYQYDPTQWKTVPKDFLDDAPACVLHAGTTYLVDEDGAIETITHEITRFNGRKGIEKLGEYRNIVFDPTYQKLTLNEARVHKAGGKVVQIEPRSVQLRDISTDYQVYEHDKQLVISFPSLEVGDVLEVKWTTRGKNPEHQGRFFTRYAFGDDTYPVVEDELRVQLPKAMKLTYATIAGKLEPEIEDKDGLRTYHWRATNRPRLPLDDHLPSKEDLRLQVALSTFTTWGEVFKWKQQLRADCWECTPEIRETVAKVVKGLDKPADKAAALTYWVRRNVRYVSVGEKHDYTPHAPALVLGNRYGDCKDTSQLLAVMLKEAGVPVALATLGALDDGQVLDAVPSPWGTHAILLVPLEDGDHWIDTTLSLAGWDFLPRDDRERLCYVVDDTGLRLLRTPPFQAEDNRFDQTTEVYIGADGSSRCVRSGVYTGSAALIQRDAWTETPPGERRRLLTAELQDANSHTRLVRLNVNEDNLKRFDEPVRASMVFEIVNHFSGETEREGSLTDSKVWSKLLAYNLDYERQVALHLWAPFESTHRFLVHLPPAFQLESLPREQSAHAKWGSFTLTVKADPDDPRTLEMTMHTRLEKIHIEPDDFAAFRKFHEDVGKHYRVWLTLKPTHNLGDAPALEALLALTPDDTANAAALAKLYQLNGRSSNARRVLKRALYYHPDEIALAELGVKLAENLEEEEAAYRDLLKKFPDEPKYAVALGSVLVDRGAYDDAGAVLKPLSAKGPATMRALAHFHLARGSLHRERADEAHDHLDEAAQADPDTVATAGAQMLRGQIEEKRGDLKEAMLAYRQALRLEPEADDALSALVRLSLIAGDKAETLDYLRRYTLAVGADAEGLAQAAEWHLQLDRFEDAFDLASRSRDRKFTARAQRVLGLVYLHREDYTKAAAHLEKATPDADVLEGLIRANLAQGTLHEAIERADQFEKIDNPSAELRLACVIVKSLESRRDGFLKAAHVPKGKEDDWRRAAEALVCAEYAQNVRLPSARVESLVEMAFADDVKLGPAFWFRGLLELEKGRLMKAAADAEQAITLSPDDAHGYFVRGRVRLERGVADKALADLERAAKLCERKEPSVLHWLATGLAQAGKMEEALAIQREAIKLKPEDREMQEQLRELEKSVKTGGVGQ
jgi:tetratricopeptide (TPR) repeat protein